MGLETMHLGFQHSPLIKQNKINQVGGKKPQLREMLPSFFGPAQKGRRKEKKDFYFTFSFISQAMGGRSEYSLYSSSGLINE